MLPWLRDRPLTLVRAPDGVGEHRYFQQDTPRSAPASIDRIVPLTWSELPGARISHFRIRNVPDLLDLPGPNAWRRLLTQRARLSSSLTEGYGGRPA
jgi:DNA primase